MNAALEFYRSAQHTWVDFVFGFRINSRKVLADFIGVQLQNFDPIGSCASTIFQALQILTRFEAFSAVRDDCTLSADFATIAESTILAPAVPMVNWIAVPDTIKNPHTFFILNTLKSPALYLKHQFVRADSLVGSPRSKYATQLPSGLALLCHGSHNLETRLIP